jgi:hypothetical protein
MSTALLALALAMTAADGPADAHAALARARLTPAGAPADPSFFPIAVWLQAPRNAAKYREAGINLYVALWNGPTAEQLDALREAGMPVVCDQNALALSREHDPVIVAWMHGDEPDNAQPMRDPKTGKNGYGPPVRPSRSVEDSQAIRAKDATRPVLLNLGQGVANDAWKGRGPGASLDDYPKYVQGSDIVSFDVYPVAGLGRPDLLWYVPKGVDRLTGWTKSAKPIWCCIEASHISRPGSKVTPEQLRAEVWMALIKGARGLIYFVHQFEPTFREASLLDDPELLAAVTAVNRQIAALAPVLNGPTITEGASAVAEPAEVPVALMVKTHDGATYGFAATLRDRKTKVTVRLPGLSGRARAEVLGEDRAVDVSDGVVRDDFNGFGVHLYKVSGGP